VGLLERLRYVRRNDSGTTSRNFPVSCSLSDTECFETNKYKDLVPDDQKAGIAYLEQRSGAQYNITGPKQKVIEGRETIRLVCWLNYPKLGLSDCKEETRFVLAALNALVGRHDFTVDGVKGMINIIKGRVIANDFREIFGRYSYNDKQWAFFWPYAYFAIDLDCKVMISTDCLNDVTLGNAFDCVTTY